MKSYHVLSNDTTWPSPVASNDIEWQLRYGQPTREQILVAASMLSAFRYLTELPQRERNEVIRDLRAADKAHSEYSQKP